MRWNQDAWAARDWTKFGGPKLLAGVKYQYINFGWTGWSSDVFRGFHDLKLHVLLCWDKKTRLYLVPDEPCGCQYSGQIYPNLYSVFYRQGSTLHRPRSQNMMWRISTRPLVGHSGLPVTHGSKTSPWPSLHLGKIDADVWCHWWYERLS